MTHFLHLIISLAGPSISLSIPTLMHMCYFRSQVSKAIGSEEATQLAANLLGTSGICLGGKEDLYAFEEQSCTQKQLPARRIAKTKCIINCRPAFVG